MAAGAGPGKRSVNGLKTQKLFGQCVCRLPGVCRAGDERDAGLGSRVQADSPPQAKNGVQHGPGSPGQASSGVHGGRVGGRAAAAQEPDSVGLVLQHAPPQPLGHRYVDRPERLLVCSPWPSAGQQGAGSRDELRLQKQFREGRVCLIRATRVQAHLRIAGQVEFARAAAVVDDGHRAHFGVAIVRHADGQTRFRVTVPAAEFGPVGMECDLSFIGCLAQRLVPGGPSRALGRVPDVAELAPAIPGRVLPPARHIQAAPGAASTPGAGDDDAVAAVRQQRDLGGRVCRGRKSRPEARVQLDFARQAGHW